MSAAPLSLRHRIRTLYAAQRRAGPLPQLAESVLARIERDERMVEVWRRLASHSDQGHSALLTALVRAGAIALTGEDLENTMAEFERHASEARSLVRFLERRQSWDAERVRPWIEALRSVGDYLLDTRATFAASVGRLDNASRKSDPRAEFSTRMSDAMMENFGAYHDEIVGVAEAVIFELDEAVDPKTVQRRRERKAERLGKQCDTGTI